ncbi:MAG: menaquinone biosynthetic enzyme MqnA/MqnD family protein [Bryobacteraceae bacterium]
MTQNRGEDSLSGIRVGAVSYLNAVPLVWGMLHGPQRRQVDLTFSLPSVCAEELEEGKIDIGLAPVAEIVRQGLEIVSGVGIACRGDVRSILLFSRVPWREVRTLAADAGSRTSVHLARVILRERHGAEPRVTSRKPELHAMLETADAALMIGDPALRIDPETSPFTCLDLGAEWLALTGLPMVFAAWAGKPGTASDALQQITAESYIFGEDRIDEIVEAEYRERGIERDLASRYLRRHIRYEIGAEERQGIKAFVELAGLERAAVAST